MHMWWFSAIWALSPPPRIGSFCSNPAKSLCCFACWMKNCEVLQGYPSILFSCAWAEKNQSVEPVRASRCTCDDSQQFGLWAHLPRLAASVQTLLHPFVASLFGWELAKCFNQLLADIHPERRRIRVSSLCVLPNAHVMILSNLGFEPTSPDWQLLFKPCSIPSLLRFLDESLRSVSTAAKGYPSILFSCAWAEKNQSVEPVHEYHHGNRGCIPGRIYIMGISTYHFYNNKHEVVLLITIV